MESYSSWNTFLKYNIGDNSGHGSEKVELLLDDIGTFNKYVKTNYKNKLYDLNKNLLTPYYYCNEKKILLFGDSVKLTDEDNKDTSCNILTNDNTLKHLKCLTLNNFNIDTANLDLEKIDYLKVFWGNINLFQSNLKVSHDIEFCLNYNLTSINLPKLEYVNNDVKFLHLYNLTGLHFDNLKECKNLYITDCNTLDKLRSGLVKTKHFVVCNNDKLKNIELKSLKWTKSLSVKDNKNLTTIDLSNLECCNKIYITNNPELTTINLSSLKDSVKVFIKNCPKLNELNMKSLENIYNCLYLDSCHNFNLHDLNNLKYVDKCYLFNSLTNSCEKLNCRYNLVVINGKTKRCLYSL
jgi:hypothetical protein